MGVRERIPGVKHRSPQELLDQMGEPLDPEVYDWASATDQPLTEDEIYVLHYAAHVEWGTENTFASLDTARDPPWSRRRRLGPRLRRARDGRGQKRSAAEVVRWPHADASRSLSDVRDAWR